MGLFFGGPRFDFDTIPTSWLTIAGRSVELPRLHFGDSKAIGARQLLRRDLVLRQSTWPQNRQLTLTFGGFPRSTEASPYNYAKAFDALILAYPGWPAKLHLRNGVEYYGIVKDPTWAEIDDCKVEISFTFDITNEYYPEGVMAV